MDFGTLFGMHTVNLDPLNLFILAWLWRIEQKIQAVILNAARREILLEDVKELATDIKKVTVPIAAE